MRTEPARRVGVGGGGAAGGGGSGTALTRRVSHAANTGNTSAERWYARARANRVRHRRGGRRPRRRRLRLVGRQRQRDGGLGERPLHVRADVVGRRPGGRHDPAGHELALARVDRGALEGVIDATSTLADDVRGLGAPDTESGEQAQETVTELADTLQTDAATLQSALDEAGDCRHHGRARADLHHHDDARLDGERRRPGVHRPPGARRAG